ncbi:MAG: primosomal protein N' [Armatimonadetes bacterium]|nr:primosomal protein N' [Armatimonadota bacterium]MDE2207003.1 primosomal protein N' [Armatimonadota bacterium]
MIEATIPAAEVTVWGGLPRDNATLTWCVPPHLVGSLEVGCCVEAPLGSGTVFGFVMRLWNMPSQHPLADRLRPISARILGGLDLNPELVDLCAFMEHLWLATPGEALHTLVPGRGGARIVRRLRLVDGVNADRQLRNAPNQSAIVRALASLGGAAESGAVQQASGLAAFQPAKAALVRRGMLVEEPALVAARAPVRAQRFYRLPPDYARIHARLGRQQQRILELIEAVGETAGGELSEEQVISAIGCARASITTLVQSGRLLVRSAALWRNTVAAHSSASTPPVLCGEQAAAARSMCSAIDAGSFRQILLFGVTASGKTEIYLAAVRHALDQGRTALVLAPEVAITAQVLDLFAARFPGQCAVLHSHLADGERLDQWRRIAAGEARVVIGARSAVFAPLTNIGLVVVDEEHDASYKQEQGVRYSALDVARWRAQRWNALLALGSATPSLESYYLSEQTAQGACTPLVRCEVTTRVLDRALPTFDVVDMRVAGSRTLLSKPLTDALTEAVRAGEQAILFLNRRGYARFVLCRDCGHTPHCVNCDVALTLHMEDLTLRCHHCNSKTRCPVVCPQCSSKRIQSFGIGTERLDEELRLLLPEARIARLDRDTTARRGAHSTIVRDFRNHTCDILLGTQMVVKGLDFPGVTLVGVVAADTSLQTPDFRAAEQTFQLVTQVAGRAGRGERPGKVVVQTFNPDHYALRAAIAHNYIQFYSREIEYRRELGYPPFGRIVNLLWQDEQSDAARRRARSAAGIVRGIVADGTVKVLGPAPAPIERIKGRYRWHVVLRAPNAFDLTTAVSKTMQAAPPDTATGLVIDFDPRSLV